MDYHTKEEMNHTKEEMLVDQFLLAMGNHELSMQVAAHGHRQVEEIL